MKLRVMTVEDQTMFLQLMAGMLRTHPRLEVVAAVPTIAEARKVLLRTVVDLLILDLSLPDGLGIDLLRAALEHNPDLLAIVVSGEGMNFVCPSDLNSSIRAVIDKTNAYEQLRVEIDEVLRGKEMVSDHRDTPELKPDSGVTSYENLTKREREIFRLIGQGKSTKRIAEQLSISIRTAETHRKTVSKKMGASGGELIRVANNHNLTSIGSNF